ncbi:ATP-binding protein [Actinocatenispora rupis]|uniref:ATP-binding protein n=1 Tax=Actinocatenispora rupis TaxID=519421 RepID=UPI00402B60D7
MGTWRPVGRLVRCASAQAGDLRGEATISVACPSCGRIAGPDDRFCGGCGSALSRVCTRCGHTLAQDVAFCTACGQRIAADPAPARGGPVAAGNGHEDRRRVSVLFIDVVSFTQFVERSDPEQVRLVQSGFFATVRRIVGRYGGLVEKYIGDAVMALFGAPVTTETAVLGCVSAALELQRTLRRQATDGELPFGFRIGVATGEALVDTVAARDGGQAIAAGDVLNTASRLQSAAPPGGVLVDGATHAATAHDFRYERRDPVTLRGHTTPTELWVPLSSVRRRVTARDQESTPLVNRVHELGLLTGALDRMITDRLPQLVTLFGRAGIGKSRLVAELFKYAAARTDVTVRWAAGYCPPFGENVTYSAFADIVKAEAGILDSDDAATAHARLRAAVSRLVPPAEAERLTAALGPLVGLPGEQLLAEDTESAWRRFVVALASDRPTVLVIEDLHWADQTMVNFVERLGSVMRDIPLLVLCTSRPELLQREPAWAAAIAGSQTISLSSMNDKHIADMYTALFGKAAFPADILDKLIELAGGNPLYAHEYFRMMLEQGTLTAVADASGSGATATAPIPDNVHAVIANRLDLLDANDRAVLQAGSVLGVVFWPDAVASTLGLPVGVIERALRRLEQRDLVLEQTESSRADQTEYRFSHVLVRDVCYQRLPRTERVAQHVRAADWLEAAADATGSRSSDLAEVVANHRFWAHEIARTLHLDTRPYAPAARRALHHAARRAYALHALEVAAGHVSRALRLFPDDEDSGERAELELFEAELMFLRDGDEFVSTGGLERLARLADRLGALDDTRGAAEALAVRGRAAWLTADRPTALRNLGEAIDRFAGLPDSEPKASAYADLARIHLSSSEPSAAIETAGRAADIAARLGLVEVQTSAMITIGAARYFAGDPDGLVILEEALDTCRRLKLPSLRRAAQNLGSLLQEEGEQDRARALLAEGELVLVADGHSLTTSYAADGGLAFLVGDWNSTLVANESLRDSPSGAWDLQSRLQSVWLRSVRGEPTEADASEVADVLRISRESGFPRLLWTAFGNGALCLVLDGRVAEAAALMADLAESWGRHRVVPSGEWIAAAGHAAALAGGDTAAVLADMLAAAPRDTPWVSAARAAAGAALVADAGDRAAAGDQHAGAAETYRRIGSRSDEILALAVAAREYRAAGLSGRVDDCLRELRPFAAANRADRLLTL